MNNKFKIVIPSYNNENWVETNLSSILIQTYTDYKVLYIDDCSTDSTYQKALNIAKHYPQIKVIKNEFNMKRGYNISPYNSNIINIMEDAEDILLFVDGDDWLYDNKVLENLNNFYNEKDCWMTYGKFIEYRGEGTTPTYPSTQNTEYSDIIHRDKLYRNDYWRASHLRTFKWWLYQKIKEEDLKLKRTGLYYEYAEDLATSFPCLEMCGKERIGVVPFINYIYNQSGDVAVRSNERQQQVGESDLEVRQRNKYDTIKIK